MALPPDLDRLGEQLARAAGRTLAARRARADRRHRVARAGVIGALLFVVLTPGPLGDGIRDVGADVQFASLACDRPRGGPHFRLPPECDRRMVLYRPYAVR